MRKNEIVLRIYNSDNYKIKRELFKLIVKKFSEVIKHTYKKKSKILNNSIVNLSFVGRESIREINKKYRHQKKVTDVLSFDFYSDSNFILPSKKRILGEVIICYLEAKKMAEIYGFTLEEELSLLFIHGLLHILGFDHGTAKAETKMKKVERIILKKINVFFKPSKNYKKF